MANNEIGLEYLNKENKKAAIKRLKELKLKEKEMVSVRVTEIVNGKPLIRETFKPK